MSSCYYEISSAPSSERINKEMRGKGEGKQITLPAPLNEWAVSHLDRAHPLIRVEVVSSILTRPQL